MLDKYHSDANNIMKYVSNRAVDFRGVGVGADSFSLTAGYKFRLKALILF